jgi:hypothetical protein
MDDELEREAAEVIRSKPPVRPDQVPDPEDHFALPDVQADAEQDVEPRSDADFLPQSDPGTTGI